MKLTEAQQRLATDVAIEVDRRYGLTDACRAYDDRVWLPSSAGVSTLHLDDVSGVPFLEDIVGVQYYQLRARVRAGEGDVYAAACGGMADYERYCAEVLGLGSPGFVEADPVGPPIEVAEACRGGRAFDALCKHTAEAGSLVIHPYMGIEAVWALGADLARATGAGVQVIGPPPPITDYTNHKGHVTELADLLVAPALGTAATVDTIVGHNAEELAAALRALAERDHERVALKMTRFASAMGNRVWPAIELAGLDDASLMARVTQFLADKEWSPGSAVLAVAWENTDISPSTQLWIPPLTQGPPRLDGIYEQLLVGPEKVFLGSIPSGLDAQIHSWLGQASLMMALVYQRLGYVGRCSFDFIVVDGQPLFVECNGRWGGTSTPMHLIDRLFPQKRPAYRARDVVADHLVGMSFADLQARMGRHLYDARTGEGRFILYNAGCLQPFGKIDVIALGTSVHEASVALEQRLPEVIA